jgi:hypothetical protein
VEQHQPLRPRMHHRGEIRPAPSVESPVLRELASHEEGTIETQPLKGVIQRLQVSGDFGHVGTPAVSVIHLGFAVIPDREERFHDGAISQRTEGANDEDRLDARG